MVSIPKADQFTPGTGQIENAINLVNYRRFVTSLLIALLYFAAQSVCAANLPIIDDNNDFLIAKWTTEQGLPQSTVTSIIQSSDGYIWIGTFGGLARFDGTKFTIFDSANSPGFVNNRVLSLYEDRRKRIWVGTEMGEVYFIQDGWFREFRSPLNTNREVVSAIAEDKEGNLLLASKGGLEKFTLDENGGVIPGSAKLLANANAGGLIADANEGHWTNLQDEPVKIIGDSLVTARSLGYKLPSIVFAFAFPKSDQILIGGVDSFGLSSKQTYEPILSIDPEQHQFGYAIATTNGRYWLQESENLFEVKVDEIVRHKLNGIVANGSRAIMFDRENNIWLGTQTDGLVRLTRRKIALASDFLGRSIQNIYCVAEDLEGGVWLGGNELIRIEGRKVRSIDRVSGAESFPVVRSMAVDRNGTIWVGGTGGLFYLSGDTLVAIPGTAERHIHALFFDSEQNLWIGSRDGLDRYRDGRFDNFSTENGLADNSVHFVTQIRDGSLLVGTIHGLSRFRDGRFENLNLSNGLSGEYVRDVVEDDDGALWIATYGGGVNRIRNGDIKAITKANGLPNNFISRILPDNYGRFWLLTNLGIYAVHRDELNAVADGAKNNLIGAVYGVSDGLRSSEANGGHQNAGIRAADGRLWFPMLIDVAIVDPSTTDRLPPQVVIEGANKPGTQQSLSIHNSGDQGPSIDLEKGDRSLEINYTGLSFAKPEAIKFSYILEGLDQNWTDAGTRRTAFYPYLPSGQYRFLIKAVSGDGVESTTPAILTINVPAEYWETKWFRYLAILLLVSVGLCIFLYRTNQLKRREQNQREFSKRLLKAHETERERMAAELHDGLGQNLLLIRNWATMASDGPKKHESTEEYLKKISTLASDSIAEARTIVQNLSPKNLKRFGLTASIVNVLEEVEESTGIQFEKAITNIDNLLSPESEKSVYRIVQECVSNIVRHSESPRAEVTIRRFAESFEITIQDHGIGFDVAEQDRLSNVAGGFGLKSIRERVDLIGGTMSVDSNEGLGTTVRITIKV